MIETRGKAASRTSAGRARAASRGSTVRPGRDVDPVLDPMEVRRILEPEVASLAAKRASRDAIHEMERYVT